MVIVGQFAGFAGGPALCAFASLRRDPAFMLLPLLGRRRLRSPRRIFSFRLRLATDMRDEAAGAHRAIVATGISACSVAG